MKYESIGKNSSPIEKFPAVAEKGIEPRELTLSERKILNEAVAKVLRGEIKEEGGSPLREMLSSKVKEAGKVEVEK